MTQPHLCYVFDQRNNFLYVIGGAKNYIKNVISIDKIYMKLYFCCSPSYTMITYFCCVFSQQNHQAFLKKVFLNKQILKHTLDVWIENLGVRITTLWMLC